MKIKLICLLMLLCTGTYAQNNFGVYEIRCEQKINPIGISSQQPIFAWKISSETKGFLQQGYRILVADSKEVIDADTGNIWDSGETNSPESVSVKFKGKQLKPANKYYWKVKVKSKNKTSDWSQTAVFTTGLHNANDWNKAKWIALQQDSEKDLVLPGIHAPLIKKEIGEQKTGMYKMPVFRKEFSTNKQIKQALVFVSGLGHFELFLNGKKIEDNFLDPGWTLYSKSALYVTYDVTKLLNKQNSLGIMLGNGFYNIPRERYLKLLTSFGAPKAILNLKIQYTDGSFDEIVTDDTWKATEGPITYSSIYGGEDFNANLLPEAWKSIGYNDSGWQNALIVKNDIKLISQEIDPLKVRQELPVVRKYKNAAGYWIYDLGQNFSGIIKVNVKGSKNSEIIFRPAELLNPDSTVNQSASGGPFYFKYTTAGNGLEKWQPQFTYYGFRYIQVEGAKPEGTEGAMPEIVELTGLHTANSAEEAGSFSCSNPMINKTYELIDWAIRSNMASVLTDCPHREKLGWLEVAHLMQYSIQYRYNLQHFYPKIMEDMRTSQTDAGVIPSITPEYTRFSGGFEDSPEWGSAFIISAWYTYKWYGNTDILKEYYPAMTRYMSYLQTRAKDNIINYGLGDWFDIGPGSPGVSQLTTRGVTATAMYYYNAQILSDIAALLGNKADKEKYAKLKEEIRVSFNKTYFDEATKKYDRNSQTANAIAIHFDIVDKANKDIIIKNLTDEIISKNYALTAGDVGYRYLLKALEETGNNEMIYRMNSKYDVPGYGWQLAHGATALTESWQAYGFVSNNHCMLGHLMEWLFSGPGGIRQAESSIGFKTAVINPEIVSGIRSAKTNYESPYGRIECEWKDDEDKFSLYTVLPANSSAIVYLPVKSADNVSENGIPLASSVYCKPDGVEGDKLRVKVGSGTYRFSVTK